MTNEELERKISALAIPAPPTTKEILSVVSKGMHMQLFPVTNEAEALIHTTYSIQSIARGIEIGMRIMQSRINDRLEITQAVECERILKTAEDTERFNTRVEQLLLQGIDYARGRRWLQNALEKKE